MRGSAARCAGGLSRCARWRNMRRMSTETIIETQDRIGIVRLNRPDKLNALNFELMTQVIEALEKFDRDEDVRCMLLAGIDKAFAAGADINEMAESSLVDMSERDPFGRWERMTRVRKPIVAAVSGYALGGGCELVMHADIIVASESAKFGQPEIKIGVIPGAGGTQRLPRMIGKARAMDLILTGRMMSAQEAYDAGLVSRIVPPEQYYEEALKICRELAEMPPVALRMAKEAVAKTAELPLREGLAYERHLFYSLFATEDQKEGMRAFVEKRKPVFAGR